MHEAYRWVWQLLADGEGDETECKRFGRRAELKLLLMAADEIKKLSSYQVSK